MGLPPWRAFSALSGALAIILGTQREEWSTSYAIRVSAQAWTILLVGWGVYWAVLYPHFFSPLIGLPEPPGNHWLLGQMKRITSEPSGTPLLDWATNIPNRGLVRYWLAPGLERVLVTSPKGLSEVLVTRNYDFQKPSMLRSTIGRILGIGILFSEGDEHKRQRKSLMPAFAFRHVKNLYPVFWGKAVESVLAMTEYIRTQPSGEEGRPSDEEPGPASSAVMEIGDWASRATLDIIGIAGLGRDFGAIRNPHNELSGTYQDLFRPSRQGRILQVMGLILPTWFVTRLPVKHNGKIQRAAHHIRQVCRDLIREKKAKIEERGQLNDVDILSVALGSGTFVEDELVDHMMTFLAAGHETTASAMQWAVYLLCVHPEVQVRLRAEVRARLPSPEAHGEITAADVDSMPYLNAVCSEVLRYFPPVPLTIREAAVDTTIDGVPIPKGTRIMLSPWVVNRHQSHWGEDATRFDPERWLTTKKKGDATEDSDGNDKPTAASGSSSGGAASNYSLLTFLHGPRSCIGQGFAKAEFACLLAAWVGRLEFELRNKEEYDEKNLMVKGGVTRKPGNGLWVIAKVLDGW